MLDKSWAPGISLSQKIHYQPLQYCTYCPVLFCLKNWNIIKFSNKDTTSEDFEAINQVVLDGISENMASLVQYGKYGYMNKTYPKKKDIMW